MSNTIVANVSRMFREIQPRYISASASELGESASGRTWDNALAIADKAAPDATVYGNATWLVSDAYEACDAIKAWALGTGGWDEADVDPWGKRESLALFAQIIAGELREIFEQNNGIDAAAVTRRQDTTRWDGESTFPIGRYSLSDSGDLIVDYYTGI